MAGMRSSLKRLLDPSNAVRLVHAVDNWYDIVLWQFRSGNESVIRYRNGIRMYYHPNLFGVENFLEQPYREAKVRGRVVVDIGAYTGDSALYFRSKGARHIYAFEPFPYLYRLAARNLLLNNATNVTLFNEGVGAVDSRVRVMEDLVSNSGTRLADSTEGSEIRVRSLHSVVSELQIHDAILKMDCEGCEYDVILNSGSNDILSFAEIILEYHKETDDLVEKLMKAGFKVRLDPRTFPTSRSAPVGGILFANRDVLQTSSPQQNPAN